MPTFEFADCPTRLDLSKPDALGVQAGSVTCSVRSTAANRQAGRVRIEPDAGARPEWFAIAGGLATSPLELEQDFAAGGAVSVTVQVTIPAGAPAGRKTFRLRVTAEQKPDTDFAIGPAIGFDIVAPAAPPPPPKVPVWAYAVIAVLVVALAGAGAYMFWPKHKLDPRLVAGRTLADAQRIAATEGYPNIGNQPAPEPDGYEPGTVSGVGVGPGGATVLLTDPGVTVPTGLRNQNIIIAVQKLANIGLVVAPAVANDASLDNNVVASVTPHEGSVVKLGETIQVAVNEKPGTGPVTNPCKINPRLCVIDPPIKFTNRIENSLRQLELIKP
ncbi:hypothetical protein GC209_01245 [bacterium]|nr:hypothetical protein [bacterium]